jgi:hypothetical protein
MSPASLCMARPRATSSGPTLGWCPSDILYLQVLSQALTKRRREGLSPMWTLCPSGGIDKIAPFVRLFGGNRINVAVLSDIANGNR